MSEEKKQTAPETEAEEKETATESEEVKENGPGESAAADPAEEDLQAKYLRLAADFQNFKRRTEKEKSDIYAYANEKLVTELLGVLDNFERALAREEDWADKKMLEGMALILKQLHTVLEKSGMEEIKAEGEAFDPNFHHAVMTESSDQYESGQITEVFQKGYLLNQKVIRPSMVKVAE